MLAIYEEAAPCPSLQLVRNSAEAQSRRQAAIVLRSVLSFCLTTFMMQVNVMILPTAFVDILKISVAFRPFRVDRVPRVIRAGRFTCILGNDEGRLAN